LPGRRRQIMSEIRSSHIHMEDINNYIARIKIKKAVIGFDRDDVYSKMKDFQDLFYTKQKKYMECEKDLLAQIERIKKKLVHTRKTATDLENKLEEEKKVRLRLEEEIKKERELTQEYQSREKKLKIEKEAMYRIKHNVHLSIVQDKINTELALLQFREDYSKEKEMIQISQFQMQTVKNEMLECMKKLKESVECLGE